ncbi:hypothetical protein HAX54_050266, partial [Datura stramonium]|nr:hypothetical protein [Datura stramonium]
AHNSLESAFYGKNHPQALQSLHYINIHVSNSAISHKSPFDPKLSSDNEGMPPPHQPRPEHPQIGQPYGNF